MIFVEYSLKLQIVIGSPFTQIPATTTSTKSQKCPRLNTKFPTNSTLDSQIALNCTTFDRMKTCPSRDTPFTYYSKQDSNCSSEPSKCPEYFRWIYEDLKPWSHTGISKDMMDKAQKKAHFKLVILNGKAYVERFDRAFQTRDLFTWWGVLQLLRKYPGKVPDLELVFNCHDRPVFLSKDNAVDPPTLFSFCGTDDTVDFAFPDWSFWGW